MQLKNLKVIFSAFILVLTLFAFSTSVLAFSVDSKEKCFDECDANCKDSTKYANKKIANDANRITFCPDKFDAAEGKGKCHCGCGLIPMPSGTKDGKPNCDYTLCDFFSTACSTAVTSDSLFWAKIFKIAPRRVSPRFGPPFQEVHAPNFFVASIQDQKCVYCQIVFILEKQKTRFCSWIGMSKKVWGGSFPQPFWEGGGT